MGARLRRRERDGPSYVQLSAIALAVMLVPLGSALLRRDVPEPSTRLSFDYLYRDPLSGAPIRFDPCTPISYVVNEEHAPPGGLEDVSEAFRRVGEATGIEFVDLGATNEEPLLLRPTVQPDRYPGRWAPVLVGWGADPYLAMALGAANPIHVPNDDDLPVTVTGSIVLNRHMTLPSGFDGALSWGGVLLHEIGHLVGLAHADGPDQLMHGQVGEGEAEWGEGDSLGLRSVGRGAGCLDAPEPDDGVNEDRYSPPAGFAPRRLAPCFPVRYVVNERHAPPGAVEDAHRAVARLSRALEIPFAFEGLTDEPASGTRPRRLFRRYGPDWAPVLIAWSAPGAPLLDGYLDWLDDGGRTFSHRVDDAEGESFVVSGMVLLASDLEAPAGFEPGGAGGTEILHHLGHLAGLRQVREPGQIMSKDRTERPLSWGPADLAGLRAVGGRQGCPAFPFSEGPS